MSTLPCGCWREGAPWHGINPPPQCREHAFGGRSSRRNTRNSPDSWTETVVTTTPVRAATPPSLPDHLSDLAVALRKKATAAEAADELAQHDAWQHALEALTTLRELIDRAEAAKS